MVFYMKTSRERQKKRDGLIKSIFEIGSEFWDIPLCTGTPTHLYLNDYSFFLSGRSALDFIIRDIQSQQQLSSVMLPSYCCETMIAPFLAHGVSVSFYPVYLDGENHLVQELPQQFICDAILVMDYFGYASGQSLPNYDGVVIRDVTHSVFSGIQTDADYIFGSLRKWAGFYTGGFARKCKGAFRLPVPQYTDEEYVRLRQQAMAEKQKFLSGEITEKTHLSLFDNAEKQLDSVRCAGAAAEDIERLEQLDVLRLRQKRRENAATLLQALSGLALFPVLGESDCPLFVSICVPDGKRDALKQHLIAQHIYCPAHWPISPLHKLTAQTQAVYDSELSIVCDQRYGTEEMERILSAFKNFYER
ncbi:MAG: hypothetical protein RR336_08855 [Oscillospiraceae bacterium]